jgi:hypothetical protein
MIHTSSLGGVYILFFHILLSLYIVYIYKDRGYMIHTCSLGDVYMCLSLCVCVCVCTPIAHGHFTYFSTLLTSLLLLTDETCVTLSSKVSHFPYFTTSLTPLLLLTDETCVTFVFNLFIYLLSLVLLYCVQLTSRTLVLDLLHSHCLRSLYVL